MSGGRALLASIALALAASAGLAKQASAQDAEPRLVTFGSEARVNEGDHDFRQLIRFSLPADSGQVFVRVFDADTGGAFDEPKGGFSTRMRYSLYGEGAEARVFRDTDGVVQETITGEALGAVEFGRDDDADGRWTTLFSADAAGGMAADGGRRVFAVSVEGVSGNDGNVFDIAVSSSGDANAPPAGLKLFSHLPTLQVPRGRDLAELRFAIPDDAKAVAIENFDAAGGRIAYAGRFRSAALAASGKSEWRRAEVELRPGEPGGITSITAADGSEIPNDLTIFAGVAGEGRDAAERPLAIELPIRAFSPNRRPEIAFAVTPLACGQMRFDASASTDPDGDALSWRWRLGEGAGWSEGATLDQTFEDYGVHPARLEAFDASGMVASGSARDFSFFVKSPPTASFEAPPLLAEGAEVQLDGSASTSPSLPEGTRIARYHWKLGDGTEIVQEQGDPDFGRPAHRYETFGTYEIELTVADSSDNPCNQATATRTIAVNAPPVANAGGDRRITAGDIHTFDAGLSHDPDGAIVAYLWDFGDGGSASGPTRPHTFHRAGQYQVRLTVLDDTAFETAKGIDTITVTVDDPLNARPVADSGGDRTVKAGEPVRFDAGGSTDEDGEILFYAWDFGDGTGGDLPAIEHTYWQPGSYVATLTVTDNGAAPAQAIDSATVTVEPAENRAPVAQFPAEFSAATWRPLLLDASAASDRDGSVIAHVWDFGDGATGSGPMVEHMYREPGFYKGRLTLLDNGLPEPGQVAFDFKVIVADRPNLAPAAAAGEDVIATAGEEISLDASASADPDGSILTHEWDFGDGNEASGVHTRHVYQFPGTYEVRLTVTDDGPNDSLTATDEIKVTVAPAVNAPPVADIDGPATVRKGEIVRFDGSGSRDGDGNILAYRWDFGDGGASPDARPVHAFHDAGIYRVRLTVTDDGVDPLHGETEIEVTVTEDRASGEAN